LQLQRPRTLPSFASLNFCLLWKISGGEGRNGLNKFSALGQLSSLAPTPLAISEKTKSRIVP